ncbi:MAG: 16S rRNA (uracil(1498)-N(3))-methyltransferase [Tropicimonas sp.]|uniref:16S rRNA (uracil(1498)-N(3))-methyltransferase n=1 Tax=Tropicimonas sp. TaxID=2067044 RepID=UPI003A85ED96
MAKLRLFVEQSLAPGQSVSLTREQAHYLFGVMRLAEGAEILVFDGQNGEFAARIAEAGKRGGRLDIGARTRPLQAPPDLWLLFAPIKKARTDFIVEKAAEMGAARILPVQTEFTNSERIRRERLQAHAVEAAEQCGGTFIPEVCDLERLDRLLADWPAERRLMFCDEALVGARAALSGPPAPWAILIGPEGGFSGSERARLHAMEQAVAVSLGPRILRADTAVVAALALWQSLLGDW